MPNSDEPVRPLCYSCRYHRKYPHVDDGCSECVGERQKRWSHKRLGQHELVKAMQDHYGVTFWDFWGAAKQGKMCFPKMYDAKQLVDCKHHEPEKEPKCMHRHPAAGGEDGKSH